MPQRHAQKDQPPLRLLLVEDNKPLVENVFEFLGETRYQIDWAPDGLTALHLAATNTYDVFILDIMLPGVNGLTLCQRIRQDLQSTAPIIMLTAKDSIEDKQQGFDVGADDYLVKPFHLRELEMRINALCRRLARPETGLSAGDIRYDPGTLSVKLTSGESLQLTGYAATIFEALIRSYPRFLSHEDLSERLWGIAEGDAHTIRTHVYALRKSLKTALNRQLIKTLHGRGYALDPDLQ